MGVCRGSLYALLHSPTVQLSWGQVAFICWGAAKGMHHLHSHHVIHRDLKSGALSPPHSFNFQLTQFMSQL